MQIGGRATIKVAHYPTLLLGSLIPLRTRKAARQTYERATEVSLGGIVSKVLANHVGDLSTCCLAGNAELILRLHRSEYRQVGVDHAEDVVERRRSTL